MSVAVSLDTEGALQHSAEACELPKDTLARCRSCGLADHVVAIGRDEAHEFGQRGDVRPSFAVVACVRGEQGYHTCKLAHHGSSNGNHRQSPSNLQIRWSYCPPPSDTAVYHDAGALQLPKRGAAQLSAFLDFSQNFTCDPSGRKLRLQFNGKRQSRYAFALMLSL